MINRIALYLSSGMYSQVVKMCVKASNRGQIDDLLTASIRKIAPITLFDIIEKYQDFLEEDYNVFDYYDDEYKEYGCYSLQERNNKAENAKILIGVMLEKVKNSNNDNSLKRMGITITEEPEIKYCSKCGAELDDDGWCDCCNRFMEEESVFCGCCGSRITIKNFCSSCLQTAKLDQNESEDENDDFSGICPICNGKINKYGWCEECLDFTLIDPQQGQNSLKIKDGILISCNAEYEEHGTDWETGRSWSRRGFDVYGYSNGEEVPLINIPDNVVEIKKDVFRDCCSINGIRVPDSVKEIGESAFQRSSVKHVRLSNNITEIKHGTFYECRYLKFISIPKKVEKIDEYAFAHSNIKKIRLPENLTFIGQSAFSFCERLEKIIIPEGVLELSDSTFGFCSNLRMVKLPNSLKKIGKEVFKCCSELVNIEIPDGIEAIKGDAFEGCYRIKYNTYKNGKYLGNKNNPYLVLADIDSETKEKDFEVHKDTKIILKAFDTVLSCLSDYNKISITIPDSIELIDPYQFDNKINYNIYKNGKYLGSQNNPYLVFVDVVDNNVDSLILHENTRINLYDFRLGLGSWRSLPSNFKFNEYKNGLYVGTEKNPYFVFVRIKDSSQKYKIHKDMKINYYEYKKKISS